MKAFLIVSFGILGIFFSIASNAQIKIDIDSELNVNNTDPYFTYGSKVDPLSPYSDTSLGFMSVYFLKGIGLSEKKLKGINGGLLQLFIRRETIGAAAFERFDIKIYSNSPPTGLIIDLSNESINNDIYEQDSFWINNGYLMINDKLPFEFYIRVKEGPNTFDFMVTQ